MAEIQRSFQRYEKKFLLSQEQYEKISPILRKRMRGDVYGTHSVCNLYYDTAGYELIRTSLAGPAYKEKFRLRSYGLPGEQDEIYAEIKKKYNGIVYKRRVEGTPEEMQKFLEGEGGFSYALQIQREIRCFLEHYRVQPRVFIAYERSTLLEEETRITFDRNLRWRDRDLDLRAGDAGTPLFPDERIVMEIKVPRAIPLWLSKLLSGQGLFSCSFSKYGYCYTNNILAKAI